MRRMLGMVAAAGLGLGLLFATAGLAGAQTTAVTRAECIAGGGNVKSLQTGVNAAQPNNATQPNTARGGPAEFYSTGAGGPQFYSFGGSVAQPNATGFVVIQPNSAGAVTPQQNSGAVMNVQPNAAGGNNIQLIQPGTAGGSAVQPNSTVNYCDDGVFDGRVVQG